MLDEGMRATGMFEWLLGRYLLDKDGRYIDYNAREPQQQQQPKEAKEEEEEEQQQQQTTRAKEAEQQQQSLRETTNHTTAAADGARGARRGRGAAMAGARCAPLISASGDDSAILGMPFYRANMVVHDRLSRKVRFAAHDGDCAAALKCKASAREAAQAAPTAATATAVKDDERLARGSGGGGGGSSGSSSSGGSGSGSGSSGGGAPAARRVTRLRQQRRGRDGGGGGGAIQPGFPLLPSGPSKRSRKSTHWHWRVGAGATKPHGRKAKATTHATTRPTTSSRRGIDAHQRRRRRVTVAELPYIDLSRLRLPTFFNGSSSGGVSWPVRKHVGASASSR